METSTNSETGKRTLTPSTAGNWLANGAGVYSQKVFLGDGASADSWSEITEAEKLALEEAEQEAGTQEECADAGLTSE